jgi:hypothetical protein
VKKKPIPVLLLAAAAVLFFFSALWFLLGWLSYKEKADAGLELPVRTETVPGPYQGLLVSIYDVGFKAGSESCRGE